MQQIIADEFSQVMISLTILCITCTIGCWVMIAISFAFEDGERHKPLRQIIKNNPRIERTLNCVNTTFTTLLASVLDSVLFLSLTAHVAGMIWKFGLLSSALNALGGKFPGSISYNATLLLYTLIITICPCLSIINTPEVWSQIQRRGFRLFLITKILILGGINIMRDYITENTGPPYEMSDLEESSCVFMFLSSILSLETETKILVASWVFCVVALIMTIVRQCFDFLQCNVRNPKPRSSSLFHSNSSDVEAHHSDTSKRIPCLTSTDTFKAWYRLIYLSIKHYRSTTSGE
jgi:hypothetical protein